MFAALLVSLPGCSQEPVYQGRPAHAWRNDLRHKDSMTRWHAAAVIGQMRAPKEAIPDLITCLHDDAHFVRYEAARVLGSFGADAKQAISALQDLQHDKDLDVQNAADEAIKRISASIAGKTEK